MLESNPLPSPILETAADPMGQQADVLVVALKEDGSLVGPLADIDEATGGWLSRLVDAGELRGKGRELTLLASPLTTGFTGASA